MCVARIADVRDEIVYSATINKNKNAFACLCNTDNRHNINNIPGILINYTSCCVLLHWRLKGISQPIFSMLATTRGVSNTQETYTTTVSNYYL